MGCVKSPKLRKTCNDISIYRLLWIQLYPCSVQQLGYFRDKYCPNSQKHIISRCVVRAAAIIACIDVLQSAKIAVFYFVLLEGMHKALYVWIRSPSSAWSHYTRTHCIETYNGIQLKKSMERCSFSKCFYFCNLECKKNVLYYIEWYSLKGSYWYKIAFIIQ